MSKIERFKPQPQYTSIPSIRQMIRIPRAGKIRLGIKKKNAKGVEYPSDVDYFVVPPEVAEVYGDKPKELDVYIPHEDQTLFFPYALKRYQGSRLTCKGDGQSATRVNMDTGEMYSVECPCECYGDTCSERGSLMVVLPKVGMSQAYQIDTGSLANIREIQSSILLIRGLAGRVAWIPLKLKRVPTSIQTPDGKTVTKALLKLVLDKNEEEIAAFRERDQIAITGGMKALPPPVDEGAEVPGDVQDVDIEVEASTGSEISHEDAPGEAISGEPTPSPTPTEDLQTPPPARPEPTVRDEAPGPKIQPGKARLLLALLKSKGISADNDVKAFFTKAFGCNLKDLPAERFEDAKAHINGMEKPGGGQEDWITDDEGPF